MGLPCLDIMVPISTILNDEAVNEFDGAEYERSLESSLEGISAHLYIHRHDMSCRT
jgi:hypothetical protein